MAMACFAYLLPPLSAQPIIYLCNLFLKEGEVCDIFGAHKTGDDACARAAQHSNIHGDMLLLVTWPAFLSLQRCGGAVHK